MYGSEYDTYMRRTVLSKKESSSPFLLAQTYVLTLRMNACCGLAHGVNGREPALASRLGRRRVRRARAE